jgi:hypothetical protein
MSLIINPGVEVFLTLNRSMNNLFLNRVNSCIRTRKERTDINTIKKSVGFPTI